jgi:hypothetical protein
MEIKRLTIVKPIDLSSKLTLPFLRGNRGPDLDGCLSWSSKGTWGLSLKEDYAKCF